MINSHPLFGTNLPLSEIRVPDRHEISRRPGHRRDPWIRSIGESRRAITVRAVAMVLVRTWNHTSRSRSGRPTWRRARGARSVGRGGLPWPTRAGPAVEPASRSAGSISVQPPTWRRCEERAYRARRTSVAGVCRTGVPLVHGPDIQCADHRPGDGAKGETHRARRTSVAGVYGTGLPLVRGPNIAIALRHWLSMSCEERSRWRAENSCARSCRRQRRVRPRPVALCATVVATGANSEVCAPRITSVAGEVRDRRRFGAQTGCCNRRCATARETPAVVEVNLRRRVPQPLFGQRRGRSASFSPTMSRIQDRPAVACGHPSVVMPR